MEASENTDRTRLDHPREAGGLTLPPHGVKPLTDLLNGAEVRALRQRTGAKPMAQAVDSVLRLSSYNLRPELKPVDRILERWAIGEGSGLPDDEYEPPPAERSKPTPLDNDTQIVVCDVINKKISITSRKLIGKWYRSNDLLSEIQEKIGFFRFGRKRTRDWRGRVLKETAYLQMTENGVILCWNLTLGEVRGQLEATRHAELLRLLAVRY